MCVPMELQAGSHFPTVAQSGLRCSGQVQKLPKLPCPKRLVIALYVDCSAGP